MGLRAKAKHIKCLDWNSKLYIDRSNVPDGVDTCWMRTRLGGLPDDENMAQMYREGWEPAPIEFHPERALRDRHGNIVIKDQDVSYRDVTYCYRAKELGDIERAKYENDTERARQDLHVQDMPFRVSDHRKLDRHFKHGNPTKSFD